MSKTPLVGSCLAPRSQVRRGPQRRHCGAPFGGGRAPPPPRTGAAHGERPARRTRGAVLHASRRGERPSLRLARRLGRSSSQDSQNVSRNARREPPAQASQSPSAQHSTRASHTLRQPPQGPPPNKHQANEARPRCRPTAARRLSVRGPSFSRAPHIYPGRDERPAVRETSSSNLLSSIIRTPLLPSALRVVVYSSPRGNSAF